MKSKVSIVTGILSLLIGLVLLGFVKYFMYIVNLSGKFVMLIMGFFFLLYFCGFPLGLIGTIAGVMSKRDKGHAKDEASNPDRTESAKRKREIIGIVCGIIGMLLNVSYFAMAVIMANPNFYP